MNIKVSIVVPVYGTENYLRKCLDSLVGQTLKGIEILVVNDGSLDNSQMIIDEYEQKYENVHGFIKENGGMSDARNYGIVRAKGEYIGFIDSDDYIESDMYEQMYEKAQKDALDIVVCDTIAEYPTYSYVMKGYLGYAQDAVKDYIISYPNPPARIIKTSLMKEHLFRKGVWYEDLELMPVFAVYTDKIGFVKKPFYYYVQREGSIMHQLKYNSHLEDLFEVMQNIINAFKENGVYKKYEKELEYLAITHLQRSGILRYVDLQNAEPLLERVHSMMSENFPKWTKNPYLKQSSWKFRLVCLLGKWKQYRMISFLKRLM